MRKYGAVCLEMKAALMKSVAKRIKSTEMKNLNKVSNVVKILIKSEIRSEIMLFLKKKKVL